jgi:hypothetical protein
MMLTTSSQRWMIRRALVTALAGAAVLLATFTASPALAANTLLSPQDPIGPLDPLRTAQTTVLQNPGSDRMLNPQPLPPKQFQLGPRFGR